MMSGPDTEKIIQMAIAPWETLHCNWSRGEEGGGDLRVCMKGTKEDFEEPG